VAHGGLYYYRALPILDWGAFLTAVIDFLVIALVLFIIVKAVAKAKEQKAALDAKILEDYYTKHPEERPAPVVAGAPAPTEMDILVQIRDELKKASPEVEVIARNSSGALGAPLFSSSSKK
jgi:large-conductance mechanosensitive channel